MPSPPDRRGRLARRGLRSLAWGLLLAAAGQGAVALFLHAQPAAGDPGYAHRLRLLRERLAERPGSPLVLVLGTSRAACGLCPAALPALGVPGGPEPLVFNFAIPAGGPVQELLYLRRLLADGVRPTVVVAEFWAPFWHPARSDREVERLTRLNLVRRADLRVLRRVADDPRALDRHWLAAQLVPGSGWRHLFLQLLAPSWLPHQQRFEDGWARLDRHGWFAHEEVDAATGVQVLASQQRDYAPALARYAVAPAADRALQELLAVCRRERIAAALVVLPEGSAVRGWYTPETLEALDGYLAGVGRHWQVPVIVARTWLGDDAFWDGHHLHSAGAAEFSRRFGTEVLRPLLRTLPDGEGRSP